MRIFYLVIVKLLLSNGFVIAQSNRQYVEIVEKVPEQEYITKYNVKRITILGKYMVQRLEDSEYYYRLIEIPLKKEICKFWHINDRKNGAGKKEPIVKSSNEEFTIYMNGVLVYYRIKDLISGNTDAYRVVDITNQWVHGAMSINKDNILRYGKYKEGKYSLYNIPTKKFSYIYELKPKEYLFSSEFAKDHVSNRLAMFKVYNSDIELFNIKESNVERYFMKNCSEEINSLKLNNVSTKGWFHFVCIDCNEKYILAGYAGSKNIGLDYRYIYEYAWSGVLKRVLKLKDKGISHALDTKNSKLYVLSIQNNKTKISVYSY